MRVSLFVTCLVDQLRPAVGLAAVRLLEAAGCRVRFDAAQTCCGQPAFNAGYRGEALRVARHLLDVFAEDGQDALVAPSGSCAAMLHHLPELFDEGSVDHGRARALAARSHELGSFLVRVLGREDFGARYDARIAWHDACHGLRDLGIRDEPRRLLSKVAGAELIEVRGSDSCCGFGGTFSVKHAALSVAMLDQKLQHLEAAEIDVVVSGDVSCLMQIQGRLQHRRSPMRTLHLAEVLVAGHTT